MEEQELVPRTELFSAVCVKQLARVETITVTVVVIIITSSASSLAARQALHLSI